MSFAFESGVQGAGVWNFCSFREHDEVQIVGDRGRIAFATFGDGPIVVEDEAGVREYRIANPVHIQQPLIETIVAELNGRGRCPSTPESAARTSRVMDQVLAGYYRNGASGRGDASPAGSAG